MPRARDHHRYALWRDRVHRQVASGLTVTQFCTQQRLPLKAFYAWRQRLKLADSADNRPAHYRHDEPFSRSMYASSIALRRSFLRSRPNFPMESSYVSQP